MEPTDTWALVGPARAGDRGAQGELFEALRGRLLLWCGSRMSKDLRARVEPEDMVQEILLVLCRDLDAYAGSDRRSFYAWVFRVAENRIKDAVDHFGAAKRTPAELPRSFQTTPGAAAVRRENVRRLAAAIETLPEDHRRVVVLRRLEERSFEEISREMSRSENAVRIVYCRALKSLRERLGDGN